VHTFVASSRTRTKIVATLGPASWDPGVLGELIRAGVDVFRINCSHSDHDAIRRQVARIRRTVFQLGEPPIAILLDLQGPKIRTGKVPVPLALSRGHTLTVRMDPDYVGDARTVGTTYPQLATDVRPGNTVLFADGALSGEVIEIRDQITPAEVDIRIVHGGELGSHKGINLPGVDISAPSVTEKDYADAEVGIDMRVDYIALSFVRKASDVVDLRDHLRRLGADIPIISKIEKPEALDNLEEILDVSDGVMVARGDLGVEVPYETVPVHQKHIIQRARRKGRVVITATQMLDSMERNPRPTRAEATDVANAILDGTDAVMLSGETSVGKHPVTAVRAMDAIAAQVEASKFLETTPITEMPPLAGAAGSACRAAAWALAETPRSLMVFTWSGATARYMSKLRPRGPIYAFSPNRTVVDKLALWWGIHPFLIPTVQTIEELIATGQRILLDEGLLSPGDPVVVLGGEGPKQGSTCFVKFHKVFDSNEA
jgi:pyruvate kinase